MKYKYKGEWVDLSIKALDSMVIGSVIDFAGKEEKIPAGWLICDGSAISRTEYSELFDAIGTSWGTGDGSTTFNLPPAGIVRVGYDANDTDFNAIGKTGGSKELQAHNHTQYRGYQVSGFSAPYQAPMQGWGLVDATTGTELHNIGTAGTGNSGNLQPFGTFYTIIKATNTTPTMASIVNGYSTSTQDGYSCDYINDINTYSTSETDTGKRWIDGKKIYRKTFTGSYNSGAELLSGVDTLVNHYGTAFISGATRCVPYMEVYNGNMFDAQFRVLNNKIVSEFMNNGSTTSSNISMTFEYTKTTD